MKDTETMLASLRIHESGDPKTCFTRFSADEILDRFGPPQALLRIDESITVVFVQGLRTVSFPTPSVGRLVFP